MKGTVRQRGAGWAYQFSILDGERRRHITKGGFPTKKAAQQALTEAMAVYQRGERIEPTKATVAAYLRDWLAVQEHQVKASTYAGYRSIVEDRLVPHIGGVRLVDLSPGLVAELYTKLRTSGRKRGPGGLSERSVKHTHTVLHKAIEDAVKRRLVLRNVAGDVDAPRPRNAEMATWSAAEVRTFLQSAEGERYRIAFVLALTTGLRRSELLGLRWEDVDLDGQRLAVRRARVAAGGQMVEGDPKSGKARTVDLDDGTVAALRAHRAVQLQERLAWGPAWTDSGYVLTREDGMALHADTLRWHFNKAVKAAEVPTIRFHDLRHTHATLALQAGVHPKVMQERLGHHSITMTLDLYSHVVPGMQAEAAAKVGAAVLG